MLINKNEWDYYIPCGYNSCEKQVRQLIGSKNKKIFMIDGCDSIASKNSIFKTLKRKYGNKANTIMPETFNLRVKKDVLRFIEHFKNKRKSGRVTKYILKNHRQRQEGLKMVNRISQIKKEMKLKKYYLVQDFLNNPFIIKGRKINLRYYFVIICRKGKIESYIYRDGFMYYTPKYFKPLSIHKDRNITTGYIDRQVYVENPLTTEDFRKYLGKTKAQYFDMMVRKKFILMTTALKDTICQINKYPNSTLFQLFGADIAPNKDLDVHFMEINKGPDIGGKDKRDSKLKYNMLKGMFELVNVKKCDGKTLSQVCNKVNYERIL
tara:strand:- start:293 stop:1258 length:966 start_codon:yes stop_codon:yes gene_type:complete